MIARSRSRLSKVRRQLDRFMTYIAAYHSKDGIVMCADTQEVVGEYKNYTEKISVVEDLSFPLAVGGAGMGDIIDCATAEIIERAKASRPTRKSDLKQLIKDALRTVYEKDLPALVTTKQHRTPELLIAAKTEEGFCIFPTKGRRVLPEQRRAIIGYPSAYNIDLLRRLHKDGLPMQQAGDVGGLSCLAV